VRVRLADHLLEPPWPRAGCAKRVADRVFSARESEERVLLACPVVTESACLGEGADVAAITGVLGVGLQSDTFG
jgi:hypothetical protein